MGFGLGCSLQVSVSFCGFCGGCFWHSKSGLLKSIFKDLASMSCELKAKEVKCFGVHEKKPMSCGFGVKALALEFGKSSFPKTGASILASEPFQCFHFISAEKHGI